MSPPGFEPGFHGISKQMPKPSVLSWLHHGPAGLSFVIEYKSFAISGVEYAGLMKNQLKKCGGFGLGCFISFSAVSQLLIPGCLCLHCFGTVQSQAVCPLFLFVLQGSALLRLLPRPLPC